jgi:hypothetical protein
MCSVHRRSAESDKGDLDFDKINEDILVLIQKGMVKPSIGIAKKSVPMQIKEVSKHAENAMKDRKLTLLQAQSFIDTAEVMFDQGNRYMYLSRDGSSTLLVSKGKLLTVYGKEQFDPSIKSVLGVIDNANKG